MFGHAECHERGVFLTGTEIRGERTTQRSGGRDEVATAVAGSAIIAILILTGVISTVMSIPYLLDAIQDVMGVLPLPVSVLVALSVVQSGVMFGIVVLVGRRLAKQVGSGTPVLDTAVARRRVKAGWTAKPIGLGVLTATLIIAGDYIFFLSGLPLSLFTYRLPEW
ncbi:MAG: hypothetical protein ACOZCF_02090 [Bacillota bacterium]